VANNYFLHLGNMRSLENINISKLPCFIVSLLLSLNLNAQQHGNYKNFTVAVYARAYEVRDMSDLQKLETTWNEITRQLKVDKIYLETHRDKIIVDEKTLETAKKFFESRGVKVAGGITFTMDERNHFETFCYSNPEHRAKAKQIAEFTARHFNEFILDDFFFTSCKCDLCIKAKGEQSWTQYRLKLMKEAAVDLIVNPAKAVNPNVKIIIKYPNWYEHFQGLGFNLEAEPKIFDGIYTGTETRDAVFSAQHLQAYESFLIFRYFENIAPSRNGGGWVDPGGAFYLDRYAEQLWLTLFAKAPEITLFDYRQLQNALKPASRAPWQGQHSSFDYDTMMKPIIMKNGSTIQPTTIARAAGYTFENIDGFIGKLGNPVGIKSYRPYNAVGEDFLQNYFGMIGLPIDLVPEFPIDPQMIILTESAKFDSLIVPKIKARLKAGKNVIITSGLLYALQGRGIEDIAEIRFSNRKALVKDYFIGWLARCSSKDQILIPQIEYLTNDSWEDISSYNGASGWPILHQAQYSKGYLYVLTIPDNFSDLYKLPPEVLGRIRTIASQDQGLRLEGPSQISLFIYDNGTCIVESFLPETVTVKLVADEPVQSLTDILSGETINGLKGSPAFIWGRARIENKYFEITIPPHSFRVLKLSSN
jgi:hypothetical protein